MRGAMIHASWVRLAHSGASAAACATDDEYITEYSTTASSSRNVEL